MDEEHIVPLVRTYVFCFFVPWRVSNSIDEASWGVMVATLWWLCILLISLLCKHYLDLDVLLPICSLTSQVGAVMPSL